MYHSPLAVKRFSYCNISAKMEIYKLTIILRNQYRNEAMYFKHNVSDNF